MKKQVFKHQLKGKFNLLNQNKYFGGWPVLENASDQVVMSFPVEGNYNHSALIVLDQQQDFLFGEVYSDADVHEQAFKQAIENLSADIDATGWEDVGKKDQVIADLQNKHHLLRPNLFNSAYESAAGFIIGNRITIKQKNVLIKKLAETIGQKFELNGQAFYSFPSPEKILQIDKSPLLNETKLNRFKSVAEAALNGLLTRNHLLSLPIDTALKKLNSINGVGAFYAQGILFRGAGIINEITHDDLTAAAIQQAYGLTELPDQVKIETISGNWQPYKMWALILLHIWLRQEVGIPKRNFK